MQGSNSPPARVPGKDGSPTPPDAPRLSDANHKLPMVMMPEMSDEAPPIVLFVRQVGEGYTDDSRIEPPAGFDCNLNELFKACVLL